MKVRCSVLLALIGVLAALTPLAYASPPDPSWIRGLYDDADFDNVVAFLTSGAGVIEPFPLDDACAIPLAVALLRQTDEGPTPSGILVSLHPRAPPPA